MKRFDSAKAFRERLAKRKKTRATAAVAAEVRARQEEQRASIRKKLQLERELARSKHRETITGCGELGDVDVATTFRQYKSTPATDIDLASVLRWWRCAWNALGIAALAVPACPKCTRPLPNFEPRSCLACDWKEADRG